MDFMYFDFFDGFDDIQAEDFYFGDCVLDEMAEDLEIDDLSMMLAGVFNYCYD